MSTLKVDGIRSNSASSDAITLASDGTCTANITNNLSNRNKLINGENLISQRGTSETGVASTKYANAPDRWQFYAYPSSQSGTFTVSQDSTAPNGFQKSYKVDCTTADTSLQADSGVILRQIIEEQNLHDFRKGFSDAKQFSLSFYVKTSKTGTYVCELYDMRNTRHVSATYTVSDTNWNRYTITFPADTTGSFVAANIGGGLIVHWWLVAGTNYTSGSLGTTWGNTAANRAVGQLNFADSTSNIFYLTGCQLEVGSVATDFEHRSYGQELELCKRYFQVLVDSGNAESFGNATGYNSTTIHFVTPLRPEMRTVPTLDYTNGTDYYGAYQNNTVDYFNDWTVVSNSHSRAVDISAGGGVSITAGSSVLLRTTNAASKIRFSAEL